jgi:16S rRNA (uracil1498-N3)-methyltransferase
MHRFFLPPERCTPPDFVLDAREAHHAHHVFRLRKGDSLIVLDGEGREYECTVADTGKDRLALSVRQTVTENPRPWSVTLIQAIHKGKLIEDIIQKATELGVSRVIPVLTERTVTRIHADEVRARQKKWQQTVVEAVKQCGQRWLPRVEAPLPLPELIRRRESFELSLLASLDPVRRHPSKLFSSVPRPAKGCQFRIAAWVGPEGDFTPDETKAILLSGACAVSLGPLVLRVETATICALSIINYEMQIRLGETQQLQTSQSGTG